MGTIRDRRGGSGVGNGAGAMSADVLRRYREATLWLCDEVEDIIIDGRLDFPEYSFADAMIMWSFGCDYLKNYFVEGDMGYYTVSDTAAVKMLKEAKVDPDYFDAVSYLCAHNIMSGRAVPSMLRGFASDVLTGRASRPKRPHRPKKKNWLELSFIYSISRTTAQKFDLFLTRNDASRNQYSACDALAEALTTCGCEIKYHDIKKLHVGAEYRVFRKEQEEALRAYNSKEARKKVVEALLERGAVTETQRAGVNYLATLGGLGGLAGSPVLPQSDSGGPREVGLTEFMRVPQADSPED